MKNFRSLSYHCQFADTTLKWFGSDTERCYHYNLKHNAKDMTKWLDYNVEYSFNEHGFRSKSFSSENNIMFLGASNTLGTGLAVEDTWVNIVANELNSDCYNLGQGGGSSDTMYRLASYWIEALKPKLVICLAPPSARIEVIDGFDSEKPFFRISSTGITCTNDTVETSINKDLRSYYDIWSSCDENILLHEEKNRFAISNICNFLNIKMVYLSTDSDWVHIDYARDLQHSGVDSNKMFANLVLSKC